MKNETGRWGPFVEFLKNKCRLVLTTHIHPDGDALGCQTALAEYLQQLGKRVTIINDDAVPAFLHFLDPERKIQQYDPSSSSLIDEAEGCIVVDVCEWKRLGGIEKPLREKGLPIACIDHHQVAAPIGDVQVIDTSASSAGELVYEFLTTVGELTPFMIDALYTCLLTDTGSFRFNNTTERTMRIAADLLCRGARARFIYSEIYESYSKHRAWLQGELLAHLHFEHGDQLCWFVLSQALLRKTGAQLWEAEGFSEMPNIIRSVQVSAMFTEMPDGSVKVSFRSKGQLPVRPLAESFGGGGHAYAAGAVLSMSVDLAVKTIVPATIDYMRKQSSTDQDGRFS